MQLHDYKYHLRHMQNLISSASDLSTLQKETETYLSQMKEDRALHELLLSLDNSAIRAFIFGCYNRCKTNHIPFFLDATDILPDFPLKDYQFIEVADNLFSNAFEQNLATSPEHRFIHITLSSENNTQFFSIENPTTNLSLPIEELYRPNITTKGHDHLGLGLASIKTILDQNHIAFSGQRDYDNNSIIFSFAYKGKPLK